MIIIFFIYLGITCLTQGEGWEAIAFGIFFLLYALHRLRQYISSKSYQIYCHRRNKFTEWLFINF